MVLGVASITITRSADGLVAFCKVTDPMAGGAYPSAEELLAAVKGNRISYGVNGALRFMAGERAYNTLREIAHGLPPEKSVNASLTMLIDLSESGKPHVGRPGRFPRSSDFRECQERNPADKAPAAEPGKDGITVLGPAYKCAPPRQCVLVAGKGTALAPDNPHFLVAAIDGALAITPDGFVEVHTEKSIPGDIDRRRHFFSGAFQIGGSVRAGFKVAAEGNILIGGGIEDAEVSCGGALSIRGGAVGSSSGKLKSQGTIKVRHMKTFAEARHDIIIAEDAMHAALNAGENISVKSILGGEVCAGRFLTANPSAERPR